VKIIRDLIPMDLPRRRYGVIEGEAVLDLLVTKLHEEADEVKNALDIGGEVLAEELADVIEVVFAVGTRSGIVRRELLRIADEKRERKGAFSEGHVIV
jgi:predicted house-cleaning noncanonical NTP pyrophosphatase (MazG superfamily)